MCDVWKEVPKTLLFSVIKRVLLEAKKMGANHLSYSGGEPLVHPDSLKFLSMVKI